MATIRFDILSVEHGLLVLLGANAHVLLAEVTHLRFDIIVRLRVHKLGTEDDRDEQATRGR